MTPALEFEFEVWCSCGEGLCNQTENGAPFSRYRARGPAITVSPCEKCLQKARDEAFEEGKEEAREEFDEEKAA